MAIITIKRTSSDGRILAKRADGKRLTVPECQRIMERVDNKAADRVLVAWLKLTGKRLDRQRVLEHFKQLRKWERGRRLNGRSL